MLKKLISGLAIVGILSIASIGECSRFIFEGNLLGSAKALTVSGGATPSATTTKVNLEESQGLISLFLQNTGTSTSLTVTYQIGIDTLGYGDSDDFLWMTPADGGAITDMTTVNIASSYVHASLSLAMGKYYRFVVTNVDGANTATVNLYTNFQLLE